jgi:hypothetical protein
MINNVSLMTGSIPNLQISSFNTQKILVFRNIESVKTPNMGQLNTQIDENDEPETKIATHTQRFGAKLVDIPIISTGEMNLKVSPIVKCSSKSISYC